MDHGLDVKYKGIKLLEKLREHFWDLCLGKEFLSLTPRAPSITGKIDQLA